MSFVRKEGKDTIIFASKEDHASPSKIELPELEPNPGLILPSGDINWNCPCLGGMATGPCGVEFREAFSCFHYSTAEPKGSDCYEAFKTMQICMAEYPALYGNKHVDLDNVDKEDSANADNEPSYNDSKDKRKELLAIEDANLKEDDRLDTSSSKQEVEQVKGK